MRHDTDNVPLTCGGSCYDGRSVRRGDRDAVRDRATHANAVARAADRRDAAAELGGIELHTFATGTDIVRRLADALEMPVEAIEVRYASLHGARFVQMYAVRAPDTESAALLEAWARVAYPSVVTDVERSEETVGGRSVTVVHSPATAPRLGTFWIYPTGGTLLVVQAFHPEVADEALTALNRRVAGTPSPLMAPPLAASRSLTARPCRSRRSSYRSRHQVRRP